MLQNAQEIFKTATVTNWIAGKPTSKTSKIIKSIILTSVLTLIMATPVFASGTEFIEDAVGWLGWLIIAIGGGLGAWGIVNLVEGYGNDNPGAKSQGMKQLMAGGALILIGTVAPDALQNLLQTA
jgi:hypothetical protein